MHGTDEVGLVLGGKGKVGVVDKSGGNVLASLGIDMLVVDKIGIVVGVRVVLVLVLVIVVVPFRAGCKRTRANDVDVFRCR